MSSHDPVKYAILGPLRVRGADGAVDLEAPKQLLLLATLVVRVNRTVPADTLYDVLWGGDRPANPRKALAWHIMQLRQHLGDRDSIGWLTDGYVLNAADDEIDAHRFRRLHSEAADRLDGDPASADRMLGEALALWRGPALDGLAGSGPLRDEAHRLDELRLSALESRGEAALALGRHAELVPELTARVADNPFRERFLAQLMVALYRAGRADDALRAFRDGRARLADSLGLDPSPALRDLQQRIVRGDTTLSGDDPALVPRQLPADIASFTGRSAELAALTAAVDLDGANTLVLTAVDGLGGVGKTALAVHAAHRLADRYPDGQLFIDLRGYSGDATALSAADALDRMLRALGVEGTRVPADLDERSALLRSVMSGRRVLTVLDNAAAEEQVRPLLPGGGHRVIVTSRQPLTGLDESHQISLGMLDRAAAMALFTRVSGIAVDETNRELVTEIVELCDRLPLALRIAASRLRGDPHASPARLRDRLIDEDRRVAELHIGDRRLAAAFRLSYRDLDAEHQRAFRLLTAAPVIDFGAAAAAVTLDVSEADADDLLADLVDTRLLECPAPGRYVFHDLVRLYGRQLGGDRDDAAQRLVDWYTACARAATSHLTRWAPQLPYETIYSDVSFPDYAAALRWFDDEHPNLLAMLRGGTVPPEYLWLIPDAMDGYFWIRHASTQWREAAEIGVAAAECLGDRGAEAAMRHALGQAARRLADYDDALGQQQLALRLARDVADQHLVQSILLELAATHQFRGDAVSAIEYANHAHEQLTAHGRGNPFAALDILGSCYQMRGELRKAAAVNRLCAYRKRQLSSISVQNTLGNLSIVYIDMGRFADAREAATEALRLAHQHGNPGSVRANLDNLARTDFETGDFASAVRNATEALRMCDEIGARGSRPFHLVTLALAHLADRPEESRRLAHEGLALAREMRSSEAETETQLVLAETYLASRDPAVAREHAIRARELAHAHEYRVMEGKAITILAEAALADGDTGAAARLAGEAVEIQQRTGCRPGRDRARRCADRARASSSTLSPS